MEPGELLVKKINSAYLWLDTRTHYTLVDASEWPNGSKAYRRFDCVLKKCYFISSILIEPSLISAGSSLTKQDLANRCWHRPQASEPRA